MLRILFFVFIFLGSVNIANASKIIDSFMKNDLSGMEKAIQQGEDINAKNSKGYTALMLAVLNNRLEAMKILLKNGADTEVYIDKFNRTTALHIAASKGYTKAFFTLLDHGANINSKDNMGKTPFYFAVKNNKINIVKKICESTVLDAWLYSNGVYIFNKSLNYTANNGEGLVNLSYYNKISELTTLLANKIASLYEENALKGDVDALFAILHILKHANQYEKMYKYLKLFENENVYKKVKAEDYLALGEVQANLLASYLTGCGTQQDFTKAYEKYSQMKNSGKVFWNIQNGSIRHNVPGGYINLNVKREHFLNPNSPESSYVFWILSRNLPQSYDFLVKSTFPTSHYRNVAREELYSLLERFFSKKEKRELYFKYYDLMQAFPYEIALYTLSEMQYSEENLQKVRNILQSEPHDSRAVNLLSILPTSPKDSENLLKLNAEFMNNEKLGISAPLWLAMSVTNKVDSGVLNTKVYDLYRYTPTDEEKILIKKYSENKKKFLKSSEYESLRKNNIMKELSFMIYNDSEKKLFTLGYFDMHITSAISDYPPYMYQVALDYLKKYPLEKNKKSQELLRSSAMYNLAKAVQLKYLPAMLTYGNIIAFDQGFRKPIEGFEAILTAARMGDPKALIRLTLLPNNGGDDKAREVDLLTRAAKLGSSDAVERLGRLHNIEFAMDENAKLADMVKNYTTALTWKAESLFKEGKSQDDVFLGATILWYIATSNLDNKHIAQGILAQPLYTGKILPQDIKKARSFYADKYNTSGFRGRTCDLVLPLIEMLALGVSGDQNLPQAKALSVEYSHCKSPWAKPLAQNSIPKLEKTMYFKEKFPPTYLGNWEGWRTLDFNFSEERWEKAKEFAKSKESLMAFLLSGKKVRLTDASPMDKAKAAEKFKIDKVSSGTTEKVAPIVADKGFTSSSLAVSKTKTLEAPALKKPGKGFIVSTTTDIMSFTAFTPDQKPDSCVQVLALNPSPLTGVRFESMGGVQASWKTKDVKTTALGVLAVQQDGKVVNASDASFTLDISNETPLTLCVQDNGALQDAKTRLRVVFYHKDGSRNYSLIER